MKNAIILHGYVDESEYYDDSFPSASNSHWAPWLQKHLLMNDVKADTPEVPKPFEMKWEAWVQEFERFPISEKTTLVGHSMGGGFIVRYLSEHPELKVEKVVLVAPWLNPRLTIQSNFFDFDINPDIVMQAGEFIVFSSDNDDIEIKDSISLMKDKMKDFSIREFHNYGHFCYRDLKTDAFPELLGVCL